MRDHQPQAGRSPARFSQHQRYVINSPGANRPRRDPPLGVRTMGSVLAILHHPATLRRVALASVIVNVIIVVTGGLVRLTDSGLGCPTWPRCTDDSYVPTSAMGIHGAIEFGNRTLISLVGGVAVAGLIVAWLQRKRLRSALLPAFLVLVGVAVQ